MDSLQEVCACFLLVLLRNEDCNSAGRRECRLLTLISAPFAACGYTNIFSLAGVKFSCLEASLFFSGGDGGGHGGRGGGTLVLCLLVRVSIGSHCGKQYGALALGA